MTSRVSADASTCAIVAGLMGKTSSKPSGDAPPVAGGGESWATAATGSDIG
jgi:hypothetical protein